MWNCHELGRFRHRSGFAYGMTLYRLARSRPSSRVLAVLIGCIVFATACSSDSSSVLDNTESVTVVETDEASVEAALAQEDFVATTTDEQVEASIATFIETSNSDTATALVAAIDGNRGERWVPWLVDLLRINVSSRVSDQISGALEAITGVEARDRVADMISYGGWSQTRELDGGAGYREFKSTLYERIDPDFGPLLRSIADPAELAGVQWGGVPLGGIPELNDPARVPAAEADWMVDDEIVLGVIINDQPVAYPLRIMARHELANDTIGGEEIALVYCTLCRSGLVFERNVGDETLDFLTSGLLLNSNKIMFDPQTETLWSHLRGVGIGGTLVGTELVLRSVNHLRWSDWVAENPDTEVLELPRPIFFDDPERPPIAYDYTPGEAYQSYYDNPDVWFPVLDVPGVFSLKTEIVGISINEDSVAFDVAAFNTAGETTDIEVGGQVLTVEPTGVGVRVFDAAGERVINEQSFWFAWHANHPDTRTIEF